MQKGDQPGFSFSIRLLSFSVLVLLTASHSILAYQLLFQHRPAIRRYRVNTNHTTLPIYSKASVRGDPKGFVDPGQIVELNERNDSTYFFRIVRPTVGFVLKTSRKTGKPYFVPTNKVVSRPLDGWWPKDKRLRRTLYAPTSIVVAQQFWNAMQVLVLYLLIAINYGQSQQQDGDSKSRKIKWGVRLLSVFAIPILPFTVYLVSPGAHLFALFSLMFALVGIFYTPCSVLRLSIGEHDESNASSSYPSWMLTREETLGCICTLGSSLYNYAGSNRTWPHWKSHFYKIDDFFGWQRAGDITVEQDFTFLSSTARLPLFVARAEGGTTFGAQQFWVVWSILPFLYISYFICMYVLSCKSPGVWIQRALCLFGICHFLFGTDVVAYRYGRGYHNRHEVLFHWTEKWSWRIAILLPIYQNCTNGHWENGHKRFPILGKLLKWVAIIWAVWFFLFQVVNSDVMLTYQFFHGLHSEILIKKLGLYNAPFFRHMHYPYRISLVTMWIFYGLFHFSGFTMYKIFLRGNDAKTISKDEEEDLELLKHDDLEHVGSREEPHDVAKHRGCRPRTLIRFQSREGSGSQILPCCKN
jgi:hypothetical protein